MKARVQRLFMRPSSLSSVFCYGLAALVFMVPARPANADDLVVNTTSDEVNGDVASPGALKANPGPDGISLREAIEAANKVPGPHTIAIFPFSCRPDSSAFRRSSSSPPRWNNTARTSRFGKSTQFYYRRSQREGYPDPGVWFGFHGIGVSRHQRIIPAWINVREGGPSRPAIAD